MLFSRKDGASSIAQVVTKDDVMKARGSSRVSQAIIGTILIGSISVILMFLPSLHLGPLGGSPAGAIGQSQQTADAQANMSADANGTATTNAGGSTPRATTTPTHLPRPVVPTATVNRQIGAQVDLHGNIVAVDTLHNTFTFQELGGPLDTITVNGSTRYTGAASSLATLTPGRAAEISGMWLPAGGLLASLVDEASNNG
jgi:hypothetical protein